MNPTLAFLHTAEIHVQTFSTLVTSMRPDLPVRHVVRADLLADAQQHGSTPELELAVTSAMNTAADTGAKVVVCTCSSIGGHAENAGTGKHYTSMRIDRAMADRAVGSGGPILVAAALESTLTPTRELLQSSADNFGISVPIDTFVIEDAWSLFERGSVDAYYQCVADGILKHTADYAVVVLAQASMAPASTLCSALPVEVLSSPKTGVAAALAQIDTRA